MGCYIFDLHNPYPFHILKLFKKITLHILEHLYIVLLEQKESSVAQQTA